MHEPILERDPSDPRRREINPLLKLVLELGPLMVFFFANARGERLAELMPALHALGGPIFVATGLFMAATAVALAASWLLTRSLPIMPLVSGVVVLIFGALTLWLQDDVFIKMKPTIVNALFGAVLLGGLAFGRSLLGYVFDFGVQDGCRGLAQADAALGAVLPVPGGDQRIRLANHDDRYLGGLQGLGDHADHAALHIEPDAPHHAPFAG